ncbi:hypothetical protein BO82DRAFT_412118 [Aspergillus uvarum CBS 121591]|uniref:Uncharacterized protein n=1 Tax=Aspergillus uvarum CBS 121591 TaxID=1448315 RepID=A0A319CIX0_9EURO|nr:hypothetical protein BO82DRAFT_412118 [Aspergillus uvarum CBS 121591]PYH83157.1 hypothetical protein BO82DRAFT_412118 [Aspergillus uvarum CBS 121591]
MAAVISSYLRYSATDRRYYARRVRKTSDDPERRPCIFHWDPIKDGFGQGSFMLFRRIPVGFFDFNWHPISINPSQSLLLAESSLPPREVPISDLYIKELLPGASVSWEVFLPAVYFDSFRPGHYYQTLWVGGQIPLWDWGTLAEYRNCKLDPKSPPLILPSSETQSLYILDEESDIDDVGPLPPSPPPLLASVCQMGGGGAPILTLSIAGPATLSLKDYDPSSRLRYAVTATLFYKAAPNISLQKPIVFHTFLFKDVDWRQEGFRLYRKENGQWQPYEIRGSFTYHRYRFPNPVLKNVGRNEDNDFHALNPGEPWSFTRCVTDFPDNVVPGDTFRYCYKGAQLDWWDWGHFQDHKETVVTIEGKVREPEDNGGRPALVVPASNHVEFTVVE